MSNPSWQLVLYGRTARADRWWRVRPRAADISWLNNVITTTTLGGQDLEAGPRFVLARRGDHTLVGGSSRAALLSDTMKSDGSRPFYTFVGWFSADPAAGVPLLPVLEEHWVTWAREEYGAWMPLDWNRHQSDLVAAHEPPLRQPPWAGGDEVPRGGATDAVHYPDERSNVGNARNVYGYDDRYAVWEDIGRQVGDVALVACLPPGSDASGVLTHHVLAPERQRSAPGPRPVDPPVVPMDEQASHEAPGPREQGQQDTNEERGAALAQQGLQVPMRSSPETDPWAPPSGPERDIPVARVGRVQRIVQKLKGTGEDDSPEFELPGAKNPMLEQWVRKEGQTAPSPMPPKRPVTPPNSDRE